MIFVGRSPENIFDYLSGILQGTSWDGKLDNLNISNRFKNIGEIANKMPDSYKALKKHFEILELSPKQIIRSKHGVCYIDLVYEGFTFERLIQFLDRWCDEENLDKRAMWKKICFLGITSRTKNSPNTWRWYQHADWLKNSVDTTAKSISVPPHMWSHMGDYQPKTSKTNYPEKWNDEEMLNPPREKKRLEALRTAYDIYQQGLTDKNVFSKELAKLQEYKEPWLRNIALELKNVAA